MRPDPLLAHVLHGREDGRGVPGEDAQVVLRGVRQVDGARDANAALSAMIALPGAVPRPVPHEHARIRTVVNLSLLVFLALHDELRTRVLRRMYAHEEVERVPPRILPVGVDVSPFAVGHCHESEAIDVQGVEVEHLAYAREDLVESPPGEGAHSVLVAQLVGRVEPVHVALPILRGTFDVPREVAHLAPFIVIRNLLLIRRLEGEPPRPVGGEGIVVQHARHDVEQSQSLGVLLQRGHEPGGEADAHGVFLYDGSVALPAEEVGLSRFQVGREEMSEFGG
mmetsp:Transcript_8285/g.20365  ORF Transcript_8285/g.20365 Transcript_8285/m.20365 type:complete len:281 (+) Transcript_8285:382-1224(+)